MVIEDNFHFLAVGNIAVLPTTVGIAGVTPCSGFAIRIATVVFLQAKGRIVLKEKVVGMGLVLVPSLTGNVPLRDRDVTSIVALFYLIASTSGSFP